MEVRTLTMALWKHNNCNYLWAASTNTMLPSWVRSWLLLNSVVSKKNTTDIRQPCPDTVKIVTLRPYSTKRSPNFEEDRTTTVRKRNNALIGWMSLHGETSPAQPTSLGGSQRAGSFFNRSWNSNSGLPCNSKPVWEVPSELGRFSTDPETLIQECPATQNKFGSFPVRWIVFQQIQKL